MGSVEGPEGGETYLIFLQHHEVEVLDPFFRILTHTLHKGRVADDVTDIFINEGVPGRRYQGVMHTLRKGLLYALW